MAAASIIQVDVNNILWFSCRRLFTASNISFPSFPMLHRKVHVALWGRKHFAAVNFALNCRASHRVDFTFYSYHFRLQKVHSWSSQLILIISEHTTDRIFKDVHHFSSTSRTLIFRKLSLDATSAAPTLIRYINSREGGRVLSFIHPILRDIKLFARRTTIPLFTQR